ncbi:MAG: hypothetical protein ABIW82_11470 [Dokdonella sp.]
MTSTLSIRTLLGNEVGALRAMLGMFGAAFGDGETYTARQPDDGYLERLLSSDAFVARNLIRNPVFAQSRFDLLPLLGIDPRLRTGGATSFDASSLR